MTWSHTLRLIRSDLRRRAVYHGYPPGLRTTLAVGGSPAGMATLLWRVQTFLHAKRLRLATKLLALVNMVLFTLEIEAAAVIGEGFLILNPNGVMIHQHTRIGKNCTVAHQVTLTIGPRPGLDVVNDFIDLGDDVTVSAGVRIIGNLSIGDGVFIGPNTVVAVSVPNGHTLAGNRLRPRAVFQPA